MKRKLLYLVLFTFSVATFAQQEITINEDLLEIQAYPNPFNDKTTISFISNTNATIDFKVQDVIGNTVYSKKINVINGKNTVDFYKNKLSEGIYLYTLKSETQTISKRLVIK
jgi:hypothetical protein